jgi:hypothetical protein
MVIVQVIHRRSIQPVEMKGAAEVVGLKGSAKEAVESRKLLASNLNSQ